MPLGFNEDGTVSSYADGVAPPGGEAVTVRKDLTSWPPLPVDDQVMVVRGLVEKAAAMRKLAKKKKYRGDGPVAVGSRNALCRIANDCDRVAATLCEAWDLVYAEGRAAPVDLVEAHEPWEEGAVR